VQDAAAPPFAQPLPKLSCTPPLAPDLKKKKEKEKERKRKKKEGGLNRGVHNTWHRVLIEPE
jgi:hypothetical protein